MEKLIIDEKKILGKEYKQGQGERFCLMFPEGGATSTAGNDNNNYISTSQDVWQHHITLKVWFVM